MKFIVRIAHSGDCKYAKIIADEMGLSAAKRGTGIALRTPEYVIDKINKGITVIAFEAETLEWAGFCCIEVWEHEKYISNTGLIVSSKYRGNGISKDIKTRIFELERIRFPEAKIFSLTTCPAVMHINKELGYREVTFNSVMNDSLFLTGNHSWVNYSELMQRGPESNYVAMVFDPATQLTEVADTLTKRRHSGKLKFLNRKRERVTPFRKVV